MKPFFNIDLLEVESRTNLKKKFVITFFDHCNVLSRYTTYALDFFIVSQTLLRIKIQNFHMYQNSNISSNFHPPSLLHHLFTSFNFLMMVCNMRQQLQILLFSPMRLGCIERKTREIWLFLLSFFLPENHFISKKFKKKIAFWRKLASKKNRLLEMAIFIADLANLQQVAAQSDIMDM
jgi:hypothetical protein